MSQYTEIDELKAVITTQDLLAFESTADISDYLEDVLNGIEMRRQSQEKIDVRHAKETCKSSSSLAWGNKSLFQFEPL